MYCTDPENIPTHPMECQWKFQEGGGSPKPTFLKESIGLNWNFQRGTGFHTKKSFYRRVWIFSGTTHWAMGYSTHTTFFSVLLLK